jgi:PQQ-dependent dehydrogenase (methanol/ethanol family)
MLRKRKLDLALAGSLAMALPLAACSVNDAPVASATGGITAQRVMADDGANWLSYGRTYDEQRFSPLNQITQANVGELGLAWYADMDTARGQEATPLVIDGKIYFSTAWSKAKAYDAVSGKLLWEYDPKVPGETAVKACCDVVNRGMAAWDDKLYMGTLDGRLVALDRATGKEVWSVVTVDQTKPYTITGAPRAINGLILIGNGGAEMGVRGYVTAYDAQTGKQVWRFYTVPDKPGNNDEEYLKKAEATWKGEWWKLGGGGTVWDAMAYDPELDLLYIGVGNGSPWNQAYRSPGGGDNLYLSSIVAIRAKTGEYVWHYQQTPGETWDFTATQHIMLADMEIDGKTRKVLMQAPKNGFFYVLDRTNGQFISGNAYAPVNWAKGLIRLPADPSKTLKRVMILPANRSSAHRAQQGRIAGIRWPMTRPTGWSTFRPNSPPTPTSRSRTGSRKPSASTPVSIARWVRCLLSVKCARLQRPQQPALSWHGIRLPRKNAGASASPAHGMAECWPRQAVCCSRAMPRACLRPIHQRTARNFGHSRRKPAWLQRLSPSRSAMTNTWPCWPGGVAYGLWQQAFFPICPAPSAISAVCWCSRSAAKQSFPMHRHLKSGRLIRPQWWERRKLLHWATASMASIAPSATAMPPLVASCPTFATVR